MAQYNQQLGRVGEGIAAAYLESVGHQILARNWRCEFGELDIVSLYADQLIAVEVKTRTSDKYGTAFDAINSTKFLRIQRLIFRWATLNHWNLQQVRVDILCISKQHSGWRIEHHQAVSS